MVRKEIVLRTAVERLAQPIQCGQAAFVFGTVVVQNILTGMRVASDQKMMAYPGLSKPFTVAQSPMRASISPRWSATKLATMVLP